MSDDNKDQQKDDPNADKDKSLPEEITLKYDAQPIKDLVNAIHEQVNSHQKQEHAEESVGKRQVEAQKKAMKFLCGP